jgi:uncharacterized protein YyaL (SSP411 family)
VTVSLVDRLVRASVDVVLVGPRDHAATRALARAAQRAYVRDRVIAWADPSDPAGLEACVVLWEGKHGLPEPAAYVCQGRACSLPITNAAELEKALG